MSDEEPMGRSPEHSEPEGHTSKAQAQRPGEAGTAASKTKKSKPHRFDHFARKMAASMLEAIAATLLVFSAPDKERWPATRLLDYLRSAEALARDMLREIAEKVFVFPVPVRERERAETQSAPRPAERCAPYFRLGVTPAVREQDEEDCASPSRLREGETEAVCESRETHRGCVSDVVGGELTASPQCEMLTSENGALTPDPSPAIGRGGREVESVFALRLAALEDVLAYPGKHAARMARALHRCEEGPRGRLLARSESDLILDHINFVIDDPMYARSEACALMQQMLGMRSAGEALTQMVYDSS